MLANDKYNKIKITHDVSCLLWFIEKHALQDARAKNDTTSMQVLEQLKKDLEKNLAMLEKSL